MELEKKKNAGGTKLGPQSHFASKMVQIELAGEKNGPVEKKITGRPKIGSARSNLKQNGPACHSRRAINRLPANHQPDWL